METLSVRCLGQGRTGTERGPGSIDAFEIFNVLVRTLRYLVYYELVCCLRSASSIM